MEVKVIKKQLQTQVKDIIKSFELLTKFMEDHNYKHISKIVAHNDTIKVNNASLVKDILAMMKGSESKTEDRRIIAYLLVARAISGISGNASEVAKFIANVEGKHVKKDWIQEVSTRMLRRLEALKRLLTYETAESALALIDRDKSLGNMFAKLLLNQQRSSISTAKLTAAEKKDIAQGFVIAIREMEQTADSIKEAAEAILFISTGRL